VLSIVRPHSHDAADSVDSALEASSDGIRAVKISLAGLGATAIAQLIVVVISGSVALLADTIHNFSDALTAIPLWIAFVLSRRAANRRYTYGYGRAEDLAGVFIVAMIAGSSILAAYESIRRLLDPQPISHPWIVLLAGLVGFAGNELVAVYRIRVGTKIGSAALVADGLHARTDGFTSLAVVFGAIGVMAGFPLADPIVGLLITVAILAVLRGAARDIYRRLMDAVDPALVDSADAALASVPGTHTVDGVRLRWIGHRMHAEAEITVDRTLDIVEAHTISAKPNTNSSIKCPAWTTQQSTSTPGPYPAWTTTRPPVTTESRPLHSDSQTPAALGGAPAPRGHIKPPRHRGGTSRVELTHPVGPCRVDTQESDCGVFVLKVDIATWPPAAPSHWSGTASAGSSREESQPAARAAENRWRQASASSPRDPNGCAATNRRVSSYILWIYDSKASVSTLHCPRPPTLIAGSSPERTRAYAWAEEMLRTSETSVN